MATMSARFSSPAVLLISLVMLTGCPSSDTPAPSVVEQTSGSGVAVIRSTAHLDEMIEMAGDKLLVLDLYADWCGPCRVLAPILAELAAENLEKVGFYKVDVDKHQDVARRFGVTGLPFVVFVKNGKLIHAVTGLRAKTSYQKMINEFADGGESAEPDGKLVDGIRAIEFAPGAAVMSIYVYRGETVKLIFAPASYDRSVHIPDLNVSQAAAKGEPMEITFKVRETGVFPLFCNGDCPMGDGAQHASVVVMQYESPDSRSYTEVMGVDARRLIEDRNPLIVDVRTPREYHGGHIENATLIPLQQLEARLSELSKYKRKPILVYCRSGNRSTVASEILIRNGFKRVINLRDGYRNWPKAESSQ